MADLLPAASADGATVQKRMIVWEDGVPKPASVPSLSSASIAELATVALSLPYKPDPLTPSEVEFEGMSNAEVMIVKLARAAAGGSQAATTELLDRVLGRPKQSLETKSLSLTYADVLKEKAERVKTEREQRNDAVDVLFEVASRASAPLSESGSGSGSESESGSGSDPDLGGLV